MMFNPSLPHLLEASPDDGDPVFDGGDGVGVTNSQDALSHASSLVDIRPLLLHGAHEVTMCVQQRLQSLCLFGKDAAETKRLLRLREPLQKHLYRCTKLLRLTGKRKLERRQKEVFDNALCII